MKIDLSGKLALVTAGSKGIGFGVAEALHGAGARVCICARGAEALATARSKLGADVHTVALDLGDAAALGALVEETQRHFDQTVDILVNNSGGPPAGDTFAFGADAWQSALERNLMSVVRLTALVVPGMRARRWGRIINLTSTTAKEPDPGMVLSNVTRAAVSAYAKTVARELGPSGITVNTVLTGACLTERLRSLVERDIAGTGKSLDDAIAEAARSIPAGFIPSPAEFAQTVLYLASPEASFLTGAAIVLDGGLTRSL